MKHKPREYRIEFLIRDLAKKDGKQGKLYLDFANQRPENIWTREAQSLLIHTILQGQIMPEIFVTKDGVGEIKPKTVIDGKQRVSTIFQYYEGGFKLHKETPDILIRNVVEDENGEHVFKEELLKVAGKKFKDLDERLQEAFLDYDLTTREISEATSSEISEQMFKLNNGRALTAAQRAITRLNVTLAVEIEKISKNDFFEERIHYTAAQIKSDTAKRCVLQTLILYTGKDYKKFDSSNMNRLAAEFNNEWSQGDLDQLNTLFLLLNNFLPSNELCKEYLTIANIPILIMNVDKYCSLVEDGLATEEQYKAFLEYWFEIGIKKDEYIQYEGKNANDKLNIEGRIEVMEKELLEFLDKESSYEIVKPLEETECPDVKLPDIDNFKNDLTEKFCHTENDISNFNTKLIAIISENKNGTDDCNLKKFRYKLSKMDEEERAVFLDDAEMYTVLPSQLLDSFPLTHDFITESNTLALVKLSQLIEQSSLNQISFKIISSWFNNFIENFNNTSYSEINDDNIIEKANNMYESLIEFCENGLGSVA